jgi:hypothetical protein
MQPQMALVAETRLGGNVAHAHVPFRHESLRVS